MDLPAGLTASIRPRRGRIRRFFLKLFAGICLAVIVAVIGAIIIFKIRGDRRLAEAIRVADRDDPDWRLDRMRAARPPISDRENSARTIPKVLDLLPDRWKVKDRLLPGQDFVERLEVVSPNSTLDSSLIDPIRAELAELGPALTMARSMAEQPRGRMRHTPAPLYFEGYVDEIREFRIVGRLLVLDITLETGDGHWDEALRSCSALLNVARAIGDEPDAVPQLTRTVIGRAAI